MNKNLKETTMVLMTGIAWGVSGISGRYPMTRGTNTSLLISARLIVPGLLLTAMAVISQPQYFFRAIKQPKVPGGIAVFTITGFLMDQYVHLMIIRYANAGTAAVLQYVTLIIILAYMSLKDEQLPILSEFFAVFFAALDTFIIATHGHPDGLAMTPKDFFWGLFSVITYPLYIVLPTKLVHEFGSFTVIGPGMLMEGIVFPIVTRLQQHPLVLISRNWLALFGIIIIGTVFAYTLLLRGITIIGAVEGSLLAVTELVSSVFSLVTIIHEIFYLMDLAETISTIVAVSAIFLRGLIAVCKQLYQP